MVGVYGPTGATTPNFDQDPWGLEQEHRLKEFLELQKDISTHAVSLLIVAGDLNSYTSPELDRWGGPRHLRTGSVAMKLQDLGLQDCFRARHPELRAYTFYTRQDTASRLDHIWILGSVGGGSRLLNASIIWRWLRRTDHDPVVVDIQQSLPTIPSPGSSEAGGNWRRLVRASLGPDACSLQRNIEEAMMPHRSTLSKAMADVRNASRLALSDTGGPSSPLHQMAEPAGLPDARSPALRCALTHASKLLTQCMQNSLPTLANGTDYKARRARTSWDAVLQQLRQLRHLLSQADPGPALPGQLKESLDRANSLWKSCQQLTDALRHNTPSEATKTARVRLGDWDLHDSSPHVWADGLVGVAPEALAQWTPNTTSRCSRSSASLSPLPTLEWRCAPVCRRSRTEALQQVREWSTAARSSQTECQRQQSKELGLERRRSLHQSDLKTWARFLRKPQEQLEYAPEWFEKEGRKRRPSSAKEALEGAAQEWQRLFNSPANPWSHPCFKEWRDLAGNRRGSLNFQCLADSLMSDALAPMARAILEPGPWRLIRWRGADLRFLSQRSVALNGWIVSHTDGTWRLCRPGPCAGQSLDIKCIGKFPPAEWTMDHFWTHRQRDLELFFVALAPNQFADISVLQPTSDAERQYWARKMRWSRPGRSGLKLAFLPLFPQWIRDLFWELLDTQRQLALVTEDNKRALQINLPKSTGGWRPLTMMEESFKAIEGPVTSRLSAGRARLPLGDFYSLTNLAYERRQSATADVLYTDCIVTEDAMRTGAPFVRIPSDYEKFFNSVEFVEIDAMQLARGTPDMARRFFTDAFQGISVAIQTRWGETPDVEYQRGVPQGTISSPELSKPAQEPILRMREASTAQYQTRHGARAGVTAYADDAQHYGAGVRQLPRILRELGHGSLVSAVGFSWPKFSVYASDYDDMVETPWALEHGVETDGVAVTGYDIWTGREIIAKLPRSHADQGEKLLGKRGTISDKHTLAAQDTLDKLVRLRHKLSFLMCEWDEIAMAFQLIGRGILSYAPLIGIPAPQSLHDQDTELQLLILARLQVRSTAERMSLLAPRGIGGVQLPSMVESMVSAVASDLLTTLNGCTQASSLARAELREAMSLPSAQVSQYSGILANSLRFLAGYGFYLTVSTDRLVSRVLDQLRLAAGSPAAQMVGGMDADGHRRGAVYCRVGPLANAVRRVISWLRAERPRTEWDSEALWFIWRHAWTMRFCIANSHDAICGGLGRGVPAPSPIPPGRPVP